jgi:CBS domain-containing protein
MNPRASNPTDKNCDPPRGRSNMPIRAKDIMTPDILTVTPEASVHEIAQMLCERHISAVMVSEDGSLVGIVSEGDLMNRQELGTEFDRAFSLRTLCEIESASTTGSKSHGMHARDVMTRKVITVPEDASLADVVRTLQDNHIRRVPVVRGAELVGVVKPGRHHAGSSCKTCGLVWAYEQRR